MFSKTKFGFIFVVLQKIFINHFDFITMLFLIHGANIIVVAHEGKASTNYYYDLIVYESELKLLFLTYNLTKTLYALLIKKAVS